MPYRTPDGILVEWPAELPRTFHDLVTKYGGYVERRVNRLNKVKRNTGDLSQHIWQQLIDSNVLEKFVTSAARKIAVVKTPQAMGYFGVTTARWAAMVKDRPRYPWLPRPVEAITDPETGECRYVSARRNACGSDTLYLVSDLMLTDEANYFKTPDVQRTYLQIPTTGFKAYLQRAIHNHFANWCRTHHRRFREQFLTPNVVLAPNSDGSYRQASRLEDFSSWESSLMAVSLDDSSMLEAITLMDKLRAAFRVVNMDLDVIHEVETYAGPDGRILKRPTAAAQKALEIVDHLSEGHTIREALERIARAETKQARQSA